MRGTQRGAPAPPHCGPGHASQGSKDVNCSGPLDGLQGRTAGQRRGGEKEEGVLQRRTSVVYARMLSSGGRLGLLLAVVGNCW